MLQAKKGIDTLNELVDRLIVVYDDSVVPERPYISMLKSYKLVDVKIADIIHDIMVELNKAGSLEELFQV